MRLLLKTYLMLELTRAALQSDNSPVLDKNCRTKMLSKLNKVLNFLISISKI